MCEAPRALAAPPPAEKVEPLGLGLVALDEALNRAQRVLSRSPPERGERHEFVEQGHFDSCWHWISGTAADPYGGRYCRQHRIHGIHHPAPEKEEK